MVDLMYRYIDDRKQRQCAAFKEGFIKTAEMYVIICTPTLPVSIREI